MYTLARVSSCAASTSGAHRVGGRVDSHTSAWRVSPRLKSRASPPRRGVRVLVAARKTSGNESRGEDDDRLGRGEGTPREASGAGAPQPRPRPSPKSRIDSNKPHHLNKSGTKTPNALTPPPLKQAMKMKISREEVVNSAEEVVDVTKSEEQVLDEQQEQQSLEEQRRRDAFALQDREVLPNTSIDPDLDVIPTGPLIEDEGFTLRKKRLELVIEEKEWRLEDAVEGEDKMSNIFEYVNAVEAYKELCSTQVPNTVSDLLSQYVQVYQIAPGAPGYDSAFEFLCMGDDEEEDDLIGNSEPSADSEASRRGFTSSKPNKKRAGIDISQVDEIIRALGGDTEDSDSEDDEDDDDLDDAAWRLLRAASQKTGPGPLHAAQDVKGRWRWLEDDLGRALERKPEGEFSVKLMSVEEMVQNGLNVNSLHEEVDPAELVDFAGCRSWDDAIRVGREVEAALEHMKTDGWEVDTRSWCNDVDALMVVKELAPLRTMSYVDGRVAPKADKKQSKESTDQSKKQKPSRLRGENNAVSNGHDGEKTPDDESLAA